MKSRTVSIFPGLILGTLESATIAASAEPAAKKMTGTPAQHFPLAGGLAGGGVDGYWYEQVTGDSGTGATFRDFKGSTAGLGPVISYTHKLGGPT